MSLLPPLPILPVEMSTITERKPVFRLNGRFGASQYLIELSRSPDFEEPFCLVAAERMQALSSIDSDGNRHPLLLALTPRYREAVDLLQLPPHELQQLLQEEIRNPSFGTTRKPPEEIAAPALHTDLDEIAPTVEMPWIGEPLKDGPWYWRAFCAGEDGIWTPRANHRAFYVSSEDIDRIQVPDRIDHPYLILHREKIPELKKKADSSDRYRSACEYLLASAECALELTAPDEDYARSACGQHGRYSTAATWYKANLEKIGFAYQMTGDARFAAKGREWLLAAAAYDCWLGPLFPDPKHFDPRWHAALETAMMTEGIAVGYDILFDILTESERGVIRNAIVEKGIKPLFHDWVDPVTSSKLPRHQTATGNWVMVCSGSAGVGALAVLSEHPDALLWVRQVRDRVRWWLCARGGDYFVDDPYPGPRPKPVIGPSQPNFGIDGGYKESIGYMGYAMRYICYFASALRRVTGEDLYQYVPDNVLEPLVWSLHPEQRDGTRSLVTVDFGDCGTQTALYAEILAALVRQRSHGRAQWLLRRVAPVPFTPRAFIWDTESVAEDPPTPDSPVKHFRTIGRVVMRTGWGPDDPLFIIKYHQNRGHRDLGTYWLFAGDPIVVDSGSADYGGKIYPRYLCHSHAHNVVWVDQQDQDFTDGEVLSALFTPDWGSVAGDVTAAYPDKLEKWIRFAICIYPRLVIIADQLRGQGKRHFASLIHPAGPLSTSEQGAIHLTSGDRDVSLLALSPSRHRISVDSGYRKTSPADYLRIEPEEPTESATFLTAYLLEESAESPETAEHLTVEGGIGSRIASMEEEAYVFLKEADMVTFERSTTDARLLCVMFHPWGDRQGFIWHQGTFWAEDGVALARAATPVDLALQFFPSGARGSVNSVGYTELELQVEAPILGVLIDGVPTFFLQSPGAASFAVPAGSHEVAIQYRERSNVITATRRESNELPAASVDDPPVSRGARTRASSAWGGLLAPLDGNPETAWTSLPGLPFPQWLEIQLPQKETLRELTIDLNVPAEFEVMTASTAGPEPLWETKWRGETSISRSWIRVQIEPTETDRIRLLFHRPLVESEAVGVRSVRWK